MYFISLLYFGIIPGGAQSSALAFVLRGHIWQALGRPFELSGTESLSQPQSKHSSHCTNTPAHFHACISFLRGQIWVTFSLELVK